MVIEEGVKMKQENSVRRRFWSGLPLKNKLIFLAVVLVAVTGTVGLLVTAAGGDPPKQIPVEITSMAVSLNGAPVTDSIIEFNNHDVFEMYYTWEVAGDVIIAEGDHGKDILLWPAGSLPIKIPRLTGDLMDGSVIIGTFILNDTDDGLLHMEFNSELAGKTNVTGTFKVMTTIDYEYVTTIIAEHVDFNEKFEFKFIFKKHPGGTAIDKTYKSHSIKDGKLEYIRWQIDVNTEMNTYPAGDMMVTDIMTQAGHKVDQASIKVYPLTVEYFAGGKIETTQGGQLTRYVDYDVSFATEGKSFTVTLFDDLSLKAYRIVVDTIPDAPEQNEQYFGNKASLSSSSQELASSEAFFWYEGDLSVVVVNYKGANEKDLGDGAESAFIPAPKGSNESDKTSWMIIANAWGAPVDTDAAFVITDTLDENQTLPATGSPITSVAHALYDPVLKDFVEGSWSVIAPGSYTYERVSGREFTLSIAKEQLTNGEGKFYTFFIEYEANVSKSVSVYKNNATFSKGSDAAGEILLPDGAVVVTLPGIEKLRKSSSDVPFKDGSDDVDGYIDWELVVNPKGRLENIVIRDDFTYAGLTPGNTASMRLSSDGVEVKVGSGSAWTTLAKTTDFVVESIDPDGTEGFTITFKSGFTLEDQEMVIAYRTVYKLPKDVGGVINDGLAVSFFNRGHLVQGVKWNGEPTTKDISTNLYEHAVQSKAGADFRFGSKSSPEYDKGDFTWTIIFNTPRTDMGTGLVTVEDRFDPDADERRQVLDPNSFEISVRAPGVTSWTLVPVNEMLVGVELVSVEPKDGAKGEYGFDLKLKDIGNNEVRITYHTHLYGQPFMAWYENKVTVNNWSVTGRRWLQYTVMLTKGGALGDNNTIDWSITVNQQDSKLYKAEVIDKMGYGHILVPGSVKVTNKVTGAVLAPGTDYIYAASTGLDGATLLIFTFEDSYDFKATHEIEYTTKVVDTSKLDIINGKHQIVNTAEFIAIGMKNQEIVTKVDNSWSIAGGTAQGEDRIPVYVVKEGGSGEKLAGAEFVLMDESGAIDLLGSRITSTSAGDGKTYVYDLLPGSYRLAEVKAPDGYIISTPGYKVFTITAAMTELVVTFTNEPQAPGTGSLRVSKVLSGNAVEPGRDFSFKVTFSDGGTYSGVASGVAFTMKGNASKTISGIPIGVTYTAEELDANQNGYSTTSSGTSGTISAALSEAVFTNTKNAAVETGSLEVKKVLSGNLTDPDKNFTFTVTFSDGKTYDGVASGSQFTLKGGQSKTINGIPHGVTYTVTEAEANKDGYTTTSTSASGTISAELSEAVFVNTKNKVVITPPSPTPMPEPDPLPEPDPDPETDPEPSPTPDPKPEDPEEPPPDPTPGPGPGSGPDTDPGPDGEDPAPPPYIPGGTDHYVPPAPIGSDNTLEWDDELEMWIELDEDGVPLGAWYWDEDEEMWIFDDEIPLGEFQFSEDDPEDPPDDPVDPADPPRPIAIALPQTGRSLTPQLLSFIGLSLLSIGATLSAARKKRR